MDGQYAGVVAVENAVAVVVEPVRGCLCRFCFCSFKFAEEFGRKLYFSEGRSSIGIKSSSSSLDRILLSSSITGADFFCGLAITGFSAIAGLFSFTFFSVSCTGAAFSAGATTVFSATAFSSVAFTIGFAFSTSLLSAFSVVLASLRGRPTLRFGAAFSAFGSAAGASLALLAASSLGCC